MKTIPTLLLLFISFILFAQPQLLSFEQNGKYGFKDEAGRILITPKYDYAGRFINGLCKVNIGAEVEFVKGHEVLGGFATGGKWGFIDATGSEIIPLKYDDVSNFSGGLAAVNIGATKANKSTPDYMIGGQWGFIDKKGKMVIPLKYDNIGYFEDEIPGEQKPSWPYAEVWLNDKKGWIDKAGKEVIPVKYDAVGSFYYQNKLIAVNIGQKIITGSIKIPNTLKEQVRKYYQVDLPDSTTYSYLKDAKWGFVDIRKGSEITSPKYDWIFNYDQDHKQIPRNCAMDELNVLSWITEIQVSIGGKWSLEFVELLPGGVSQCGYSLGFNDEGLITPSPTAKYSGGKYGYIDTTGKEIIPVIYDEPFNFPWGLTSVKLNNKWGFIDSTGKTIIPFEYDTASYFTEKELACVKLKKKFGCINKSNKIIIPIIYDEPFDFMWDFNAVKLNGKCGFIDSTGQTIIPFLYDEAFNFKEEKLARVKLNKKYGFINKLNKIIIPFVYDEADDFNVISYPESGGMIGQGKAKVKLNGKEFYIDKTGKRSN